MAINLIFNLFILSQAGSHYDTLMNEYKGYIDTWDAIYKLDTNEIDSTAGLYKEIKNNLIDTGYYTAIKMISMLTVIGEQSFHYPHGYLELINRINEEYHCVDDDMISFITETLEVKINTPKYAILYDNADELLYHLKSERLDLNELLEKCCWRGAINCFKLLRKEFDVEISKACLGYSFKGGNQYIIQECLKVQKPDETILFAAISSHNINNFLYLFNEYEFYDWIYRTGDFENLHAFIIYLNATNNVNDCFIVSPKFHIPALCEYLIANGADINYWGPNGITALYNAIIANQTKIASALILNKTNIVGTYLKKAIKKNNAAIVELLVSHGANVNSKDKNGFSVLMTACEKGYTNIADILISKGANVNYNNNIFLQTPLMSAIVKEHKEIAELLILHGAKVNMQDFAGMTALHYAILHFNPKLKNYAKDLIELLLSNGADVNAKSHKGMTPLHYAAQRGKNELFEILVSNGADIHALNKDKKTPDDLAAESEKNKNEFKRTQGMNYDEERYNLESYLTNLLGSMDELKNEL